MRLPFSDSLTLSSRLMARYVSMKSSSASLSSMLARPFTVIGLYRTFIFVSSLIPPRTVAYSVSLLLSEWESPKSSSSTSSRSESRWSWLEAGLLPGSRVSSYSCLSLIKSTVLIEPCFRMARSMLAPSMDCIELPGIGVTPRFTKEGSSSERGLLGSGGPSFPYSISSLIIIFFI